MGRRPVLSQYPHLHNILRNDPVANQQFNAAISGLRLSPADDDEPKLQKQLDEARKQTKAQEGKVQEASKLLQRQRSFIKILGETIEAQTNLEPYSADIDKGRKYNIEFSPDQIRVALRLYWDVTSQDMEASIARVVSIKAVQPGDADEFE
jgi:hypothetical protein